MAITKKGRNGPRSNFSFLPFDLQYRIIGLIQDGATAKAIAADPAVKAAYLAMDSEFTRSGMTRIKRSKQYQTWGAQRLKERTAIESDRLTTALLKENASAETISEQAKVALLKAMSDVSDLSDVSDPGEKLKAIRALAGTLGALDCAAKDNRIAQLTRRLEDAKRQSEAAEAEWKAREAELMAQITQLKNGAKPNETGLSEEALKMAEEKIGLI